MAPAGRRSRPSRRPPAPRGKRCAKSQRRPLPELPEVETVRSDLASVLPGRCVKAVEVTGRRTVRRQTPAAFAEALVARRFGAVERHGKYLVIRFDDDGRNALVIHLRMSGQVRLSSAGEARANHTHVVLDIGDGREMRFVDPRTFGELFVDPLDDAGRPVALGGLGPDALDPRLTSALLHRRITSRRRGLGLKAALLDQRVLAGVGNIYADESLFAAGLRPDRLAAELAPDQASVLHGSLRRILRAAVKARGTTFADAAYLDTVGRAGSYGARHKVYARTDQPCPRCGTPIRRIIAAARGTHFCPSCQT